MKNRTQVVAIGIVQKGNRYLLTKRVQRDSEDVGFHDKWQFPGGGLEFGESPEQTVIRELKEEIGVVVRTTRFLPPLSVIHYGWWQGILLSYVCELANPESSIVLNEEASEYRWCTVEEIKRLDAMPSLCEIADML
ncbi:MAG: NUDIX hydrolase [Candidatus Roizmanbacteria bacterium]|nr:NUDIX hydrolase [Candidatus Roizmanbacteria bacterium]